MVLEEIKLKILFHGNIDEMRWKKAYFINRVGFDDLSLRQMYCNLWEHLNDESINLECTLSNEIITIESDIAENKLPLVLMIISNNK